MTEGSVQDEDVTIIKIRAAPQCMRRMLATVRGEMDSNKIDVSSPLTPKDRSPRQRADEEKQDEDSLSCGTFAAAHISSTTTVPQR